MWNGWGWASGTNFSGSFSELLSSLLRSDSFFIGASHIACCNKLDPECEVLKLDEKGY